VGNTLSCCVCPSASPRLGVGGLRGAGCRGPTELDFGAGEGRHLQHISDREGPEDLALEAKPSDHPRAGTIFLSKSQTDVREERKSNHLNHVSPGQLAKKYSSCPTIFLDDSTVSQPNLRTTIKRVISAIYYHIKNRDANRSLDIFDERSHPLTREGVPEEYFKHDPEHKFIYRFVHALFSAAQLTAECPILLQFNIHVPASVYAKFYFDLCSLAGDNLKAISRLGEDEYKDLGRVAVRRAFSADNFIGIQRSNAILS
ncbi:hypothetical protein FD755_014498, partial [Muntiacus reevesi]